MNATTSVEFPHEAPRSRTLPERRATAPNAAEEQVPWVPTPRSGRCLDGNGTYGWTRGPTSIWAGDAVTTVREIMSTELATVDPSTQLTEAARVMSAARAGSVVVIDDGTLVGIFTERDILRALGNSSTADLARVSNVSKWMARDPVTVGPETTVAEALNQMLFGGFRHLPVMEGDSVVGMVSMRDLAKSMAGG
jgi:CBS domain-containing protein